jgi:hypothetical protein
MGFGRRARQWIAERTGSRSEGSASPRDGHASGPPSDGAVGDRVPGPELGRETAELATGGPVRLRTVGDFLKLVGIRIELTTTDGQEFEATVRDLSDTGTHILLGDVLRLEHSTIPSDRLLRVAVGDLAETGDLSQYAGKPVRLQLKTAGFVVGHLRSAPAAGHDVELALATFYRPCATRSVPIADVSFVEVVDRGGIPF